MNPVLKSLHLLGPLLLLSSMPALAAAPGEPAVAQRPARQWSVRVEVLIVALPQAMALKTLPELRDAKTIDAAVEKILGAIGRKEATLVGYPVVESLAGGAASSKAVREISFPGDTAAYRARGSLEAPAPSPPPGPDAHRYIQTPRVFATQDMGIQVGVEATVPGEGDLIQVALDLKRSSLQGIESFENARMLNGNSSSQAQPQINAKSTTSTLMLHAGQRTLLAVHNDPGGTLEISLIQAFATPVPAAPPPR